MSRDIQQLPEKILSTKKLQNKKTYTEELQVSSKATDIRLDQILQTVSELEHCLLEDHQQDYKLCMALEKQTERVQDLHACLNNEKQKNKRLVDLILNVDSCPSEEDDCENSGLQLSRYSKTGRDVLNRWHLNTVNDAYKSISPLLMQQRYEELSTSYKQCCKRLLNKGKQLRAHKCEKEILQTQYDNLIEEYRKAQKNFEVLCARYLSLQKKKNYEIQQLRESLTYASDCIIVAQQIFDSKEEESTKYLQYCSQEFEQNLQLFIKTLKLCEFTQCQFCYISNRMQ